MRNYESVFVIKPDLEAEATAALIEKFTKLIADQGGEVVQVNEWGKKRMAYEVRKYREGYYVIIEFKGAPNVSQELERLLRINDDILRYLITRLEEKPNTEKEVS
ncbi:MAG: small subunit ribosomal protein [Clostridia bacterium]|nr:small subunit ribosomal protein [Clostridia bacterium]